MHIFDYLHTHVIYPIWCSYLLDIYNAHANYYLILLYTLLKSMPPSFYDENWFASHNTDVAKCWPWYVPTEIGELNILSTSRFHEMFEGWTSINYAWQIQLSNILRLSMARPLHTHFARCGFYLRGTHRNSNICWLLCK